MLQRWYVYVLFVLTARAVRDTSPALKEQLLDLARADKFNMTRLSPGTNASVGECEAEKIERETSYCLSIGIPIPVFPMLRVEGALKIRFMSDHLNCFTFKVAAALRVKIFVFATQFVVEYGLQQIPRSRTTMCSETVPTTGIVLSYIFNRVLQYAKGTTGSALSDSDDEVDAQLDKVKKDWKAAGKHVSPINHLKLRNSMLRIFNFAKDKYGDLRSQYGADGPQSIAEAVNLAIRAHAEAQLLNGATEPVSNCFELKTERYYELDYLWCYFANMYTFTQESYTYLAETTCLDLSGEEHKLVWTNVKDSSMGLIVEANADLCSGDRENCLVTFPRDFLAVYPCTSMLLITYMVLSGDDYDGSTALRLINSAITRQFSDQYMHGTEENGTKFKVKINHFDFAGDVDLEREHARVIFSDVEQKVMNKKGTLNEWYFIDPDDWEIYLNAYGRQLKRMVQPREGKENSGYGASVTRQNYRIKDTLGISFSLSSLDSVMENAGTSFCSAPYLKFTVYHQVNLNTWTKDRTCIEGAASIPLATNSETEVIVNFGPTWCYDYEKEESEIKFPVSIQFGTYSCARSFFNTLQEDPEATICLNARHLSFQLVNQALKDLIREMRGFEITVGSERWSMSSVKKKLNAILEVMKAAIVAGIAILSENAIVSAVNAAVDFAVGSLSKLMPVEIKAACLHYSRQTLELTEAWAPPKGKKPEDALKTPVLGYQNMARLHVSGVTVKAAQAYETQFIGLPF